MTISLRSIQIGGYAFVVLLMGALTISAGITFISNTIVKEAQLKVQMDLNSAWAAYNEEAALLQMSMGLVSQQRVVRDALFASLPVDTITARLEALRVKHNFDYLTLIDQDGLVRGASLHSVPFGSPIRRDAVIDQALLGNVVHGTVLIDADDLQHKSATLAETAFIPVKPTPMAVPSDVTLLDRGMALETAIPILGRNDEIAGALYGGILLNRRHHLVDKVRNAVFGEESYGGKPLGTVTIFLGDVRIATNVIQLDSTRAIGTRVSEDVYRTVLVEGERFGDRAFVVNDWYLSAYDPIRDPNGKIIGILYVGLLEQKYVDYKATLTTEYIGIGMVALLLSLALALLLSGRIRKPILKLVEATRQLSAGRLDTRIQVPKVSRETTELARAFNMMAESLEADSRMLQEASMELQKAYMAADERNRAYLEMLGFVTHELKSPLASIVFAISSLREGLLGPMNEQQLSILKSCSNSADYLHSTIANFLSLSRIEEGGLTLKTRKINVRGEIADAVIMRLSEMAADNEMRIHCGIPEGVTMICDPDLLSSVFQNLVSNAIKYGNRGSEIRIDYEQTADGKLRFSFYNEGPGFSSDEAEALFTKFSRFTAENYSTKSGTGLGLFVTRNIVSGHGGTVHAESEQGAWARFVVELPTQPPEVSAVQEGESDD
jgi:two-component system, NtrC family, sensor kinase